MRVSGNGILLMMMAWPAAADAQPAGQAAEVAFTGPYAGAEIGAHEHHFYIKTSNRAGDLIDGRYYRAWGIGGGAFAGYDAAVAPRVRIGGEVGISLGGDNPVARLEAGTYSQHPRWGYRATAKIGYLIGERLLAYGTFGCGGHRYRIANAAGVLDAHEWGSSFTIGAGAEYRLSDGAGVRLDFRHLDNSMSHILIGVPVRF